MVKYIFLLTDIIWGGLKDGEAKNGNILYVVLSLNVLHDRTGDR